MDHKPLPPAGPLIPLSSTANQLNLKRTVAGLAKRFSDRDALVEGVLRSAVAGGVKDDAGRQVLPPTPIAEAETVSPQKTLSELIRERQIPPVRDSPALPLKEGLCPALPPASPQNRQSLPRKAPLGGADLAAAAIGSRRRR